MTAKEVYVPFFHLECAAPEEVSCWLHEEVYITPLEATVGVPGIPKFDKAASGM
jgi:hypothetical protein